MKERMKHLILVILLVVLDQVSKFWVRTDLVNQDKIDIIPNVLNLQYSTNTGAVWGILSGKVDFLKIVSLLIIIVILFFYFKVPEGKKFKPLKLLIVFIVAGALGNIIDRFYLGHVIDFIYFEIINFPLFNFADCYLTVSSIVLFLLAMFYYKDEDLDFLNHIFKKKSGKSAILVEDAKGTNAQEEGSLEEEETSPEDTVEEES